jgi:DNA-binding LacI/PurR family transcriptional regulator
MAETGEIWQHPTNGRYFPPGAQALRDRPKPVACLIRRLELGSELYRELLEGISAGCGERQRTMLLWHDDRLVNHPDTQLPPTFATIAQQRAILHDFIERHGASAGGYLLDHLWSDEALRTHVLHVQPAVMLYRSCDLPGIGNVAVDFRAGALKALAHLLGRGFDHITYVEPFNGDPAVTEFGLALEKAAAELGCANRLSTTSAATPRERSALIDRLGRSSRRNALLCPEDHVALLLANSARQAGVKLPERAGVLSVMGTSVAVKAGFSCLQYDFRALGRMAVEALGSDEPVRRIVPPQFVNGDTT